MVVVGGGVVVVVVVVVIAVVVVVCAARVVVGDALRMLWLAVGVDVCAVLGWGCGAGDGVAPT